MTNELQDKFKKFISKFDIKDGKVLISLNKNTEKNKVKIEQPDNSWDLLKKLEWIYNIYSSYLKIKINQEEFKKLGNERVGDLKIEKCGNNYKVLISLKPKEKKRRIEILIETILSLYRTIEGRPETLNPIYTIWSSTLPNPVYHTIIDDIIISTNPLQIDETKIKNAYYGKTEKFDEIKKYLIDDICKYFNIPNVEKKC
jgi:hypothetical protein